MKFRVVETMAVVVTGILLATAPAQGQTILFQEGFNDTAFTSRGWYDGTVAITTAEKYSGAAAMECHFLVGGTKCASGMPTRHLFTDSDTLYVAFYIKHSASWIGSGVAYHPHLFVFLSNLDTNFVGPAFTYFTGYIENIGGIPQMGIQDGKNIDQTRIGQDLTNVTEQRSVAGCNGDSDGFGPGDCYRSGTLYNNGKMWRAGRAYFNNTPGSSEYKGDWHLIEAFFRMNSIVNGVAARDGALQMWYDGGLIINAQNVVLRTGARATMKFRQLELAPFIGVGSPADQTLWIDDLIVATGRPATPPPPPNGGSSGSLPSAPTNLRIVP